MRFAFTWRLFSVVFAELPSVQRIQRKRGLCKQGIPDKTCEANYSYLKIYKSIDWAMNSRTELSNDCLQWLTHCLLSFQIDTNKENSSPRSPFGTPPSSPVKQAPVSIRDFSELLLKLIYRARQNKVTVLFRGKRTTQKSRKLKGKYRANLMSFQKPKNVCL